jgi:hypothetical protein
VWHAVYQRSQSVAELIAALGARPEAVLRTVAGLHADGLLSVEPEGPLTSASQLASQRLLIPVGAARGWEVAVFDHFRAVATAIASKLRHTGPRSRTQDQIGGATLVFEISEAHPMRDEVRGLLARVRAEVNAVWERHSAHNRQHPIAEDERVQVTFYFGQNVEPLREEGAR